MGHDDGSRAEEVKHEEDAEAAQMSSSEDDSGSALVQPSEWTWIGCSQILGAFFLNMNTMGLISSFGVFQTYYSLERFANHSPFTISWIGSVQAYLMFVLSVFVGPAFDAGYLRPLLWSGSFLTILGLFMTSLCKELWQCFLAQGVVIGVGIGSLYVSAPSLVSMHFQRQQAFAMGLTSAGGGIGGIMFPIIFDRLQPTIGFPWATRILGFIVLATSTVPLLTIEYPRNTTAQTPAPALTAPRSGTDERQGEGSSGVNKVLKRAVHTVIDTTALKEIPWMLGIFSLLLSITGLYVVLYYVNLYAVEKRVADPDVAWSMLLIVNTASVLGRVVPIAVADYIGHTLFLSVNMFLAGILVFCLLPINTRSGFIIWSTFFGIASGAGHAVVGAAIVSLSTNKSRIGARQGMALGIVGHGMLVAGPIAGAILDSSGGWTGLLSWCGSLMTLGALFAGGAWASNTRIVQTRFPAFVHR